MRNLFDKTWDIFENPTTCVKIMFTLFFDQ